MHEFSPQALETLIDKLKDKTGKRWTIRELAQAIDISPSYLTLLKKGKRTEPSLDVLQKLCQFFQVTPQYFLIGEPDQTFTASPEMEDTDIFQVRQILELGEKLLRAQNAKNALEILDLVTLSVTKHPELWIQLQMMRANAYVTLGEHKQALDLLDRCFQFPLSILNEAQAYQIRSRIHYYNENFSACKEDLLHAKTLAESINAEALLFKIHYSLGLYYNVMSEYGSSIYHYECAIKIFSDQESQLTKAHLLMGVGNTYLRLQQIDDALAAYQDAKVIYTELNEKKFVADILHNIARVHIYRNEFELSIQELQKALQMHKAANDLIGAGQDLLELASCYKELDQWSKVEEYARSAYLFMEGSNKRGPESRAKCLRLEAQLRLGHDPELLLASLQDVEQVYRELNWLADLAHVYTLQSECLTLLGRTEEALQVSHLALKRYQERNKLKKD